MNALHRLVKDYSSSLSNHLEEMIDASKRIHTDRSLIDYTDHGINHSERIVSLICDICSKSDVFSGRNKKSLNPYEAFILLAAVYLHDIGMQISENSVLNLFAEECQLVFDENNKDDFVRKNHHLLSSFWVRQNLKESTLLPAAYYGEKELGEYVSLVIESHGMNFGHDERFLQKHAFKGSKIRLNLLALLLSLGDALDCDCRRIDYEKLKYSRISFISKIHRLKHYYVSSVEIENGIATIYYQFPQCLSLHERKVYEVFFCTLNIRWIKDAIDNNKRLFEEYGIKLSVEEIIQFSTIKDCLDEEQYSFIEGKVVDIVSDKNGDNRLYVSAMSIAIGILRCDSHVLLVRRREKEDLLEWQFPAGIIKPTEDAKNRVINEVLDETGITVEVDKEIGKRIHPNTKAVCYYYSLRYVSGEIVNGDEKENREVKWVSIDDYKNYITSDIFYPIRKYLE